MLLDYPVARPPPAPPPPPTQASEILSSGRTSQVALGGLPGAKDKGQTSLWVRLTLHHTRLSLAREKAQKDTDPEVQLGRKGFVQRCSDGDVRTAKVTDVRVVPGMWRFLLGLVAGAFAAVSHGCCVLRVEAEAAGSCVKDISCHGMWG